MGFRVKTQGHTQEKAKFDILLFMNEFISLRKKFKPKKVKFCFIFESPPAHGGYFYDPTGRTTELLFRSLVKTLFNKNFESKTEGLEHFQKEGFYLVNPIYIPVNKLSDKTADEMILENYDLFKKDMIEEGLQKTPLIIVKSNVWKLLKDRLVEDDFNVLNREVMIPFPMHYHFESFKEKVRVLLKLKKINFKVGL